MRAFLLCLAMANPALATSALAQDQMSAAEFEAYATGKTLTYGLGGTVYGIEQYLPNRRVLWAFEGDMCRDGYWYEEAGEICFVYENDSTPQCWTFEETDRGLRARFMGDPPSADLSEVGQSDTPLICAGPDVGV